MLHDYRVTGCPTTFLLYCTSLTWLAVGIAVDENFGVEVLAGAQRWRYGTEKEAEGQGEGFRIGHG